MRSRLIAGLTMVFLLIPSGAAMASDPTCQLPVIKPHWCES